MRLMEFSRFYLRVVNKAKRILKGFYIKLLEVVPDKYFCSYIKNRVKRGRGFQFRKPSACDKKSIVFITGNPGPRSVKIIGALIRKGYQVIILEYGTKHSSWMGELQEYQMEYFYYDSIEELLYMAMQYEPMVYYFEPIWGDCSVAEIMLKHRKVFGKLVIALYDVLNDGYVRGGWFPKKMERYCLENADGIVWRWFSKEFLEEKKGFVYKGKSIQFLDYCIGNLEKEKVEEGTQLKLCYVGGKIDVFLDRFGKQNNGYIRMAGIKNILEAIGDREDCVFHFFSGRECSTENKEICKTLEKQYPNFKVFYDTPYGELLERIVEYDYGCFWHTGGKPVPMLKDDEEGHYGSTYMNSMTNKFFDYLDAGLPIIATRPLKLCKFLEKYGVVVKMDTSNIDIDYLKEHKLTYRKRVEKAREELSIDNQIQRLINFFEEIA